MVSMDQIHAFVLPNKVLMIIPDGADGILQEIKKHLKVIVQSNGDAPGSSASPKPKDTADNDDDDMGNATGDSDTVENQNGSEHPQRDENAPALESDDAVPLSPADSKPLERPTHDKEQLAKSEHGEDLQRQIDTTETPREDHVDEYQKLDNSKDEVPKDEHTDPLHAFAVSSARSSVMQMLHHSRRSVSVESELSAKKLEHRSVMRTRSYDSQDETPFHFTALELIFDTAAVLFKKEVDFLRLSRDQIRSIIDSNELLTQVNALRSKIVATRQAVEDFMSDEKELAMMSFDSILTYYGEKDAMSSPIIGDVDAWQPYEMDVNEAEDLAEDFVSRLDDAVNEIDMLKFDIERIHSNLKHLADVRRERLMKCHIRIQGATCLAAPPTLVAGIFGMNMYSGLMPSDSEDTSNFWITFALCMFMFVGGIVAFILLTNKFFKDTDLTGLA